MRNILSLFAVAVLLFLGEASAQNRPVYQTGTPSRGHAAMWSNSGLIQDAGGALNGHLLSAGIVPLNPTFPPFCVNDALISSPGGYHQLCISSADAFGDGGQLTYGSIGGAPNDPLTIQSGNILAMTSGVQQVVLQNLPQTVAGDVPVCINAATGQLFQAPTQNAIVLLTDDSGQHLLTDDTGTYLLTATLVADQCLQQQ